MILLLLALGCGPDDQALVQQASQAPPADKTALCRRVGDIELRGPCLEQAARALAPTDPEAASRACGALGAGQWRDRCWASLPQALGHTGEDALELCGRAGSLAADCAERVGQRQVTTPSAP